MDKPAYVLEFEKPLRELTKDLDALHQKSLEHNLDVSAEVKAMEKRLEQTGATSIPISRLGSVSRSPAIPSAPTPSIT